MTLVRGLRSSSNPCPAPVRRPLLRLKLRLVPPTPDRALLNERLRTLAPGQLGSETNLASPIVSAVNRLKNSDSPRRVLVLFTDGAHNVAYRVTPEQAALLAKECRVVIHTVGIGGNRAVAAVKSPRFGIRLHAVRGDFDETLLRRISEATGGRYFHAGDAEGLGKVCAEIDALERTEKRTERFVEYREYAPALALAALALLLLGVVLECTWKLRLP